MGIGGDANREDEDEDTKHIGRRWTSAGIVKVGSCEVVRERRAARRVGRCGCADAEY